MGRVFAKDNEGVLPILSYLTHILITGLLLIALAACRSQSTASRTDLQSKSTAAPTYTPVTLNNCGVTQTYQKPPERAVTLSQAATEVMLALGLDKRMVGTAFQENEILPEYRTTYAQIPVLAKSYPSQEVLLSVEPDFIYGTYLGAFDKKIAGSRQELLNVGIHSYLSLTHCEQEQFRPQVATVEDVYSEIRDLGRIFGVEDRAQKLVASLKEQLKQTHLKLGKVDAPKRIFWYNSGGNPPVTATCCGIPNEMIKLAGGHNIFQDLKGRRSFGTVNWEDVVVRNPDVIVLIEADWSSAQQKRKLLETNPAYSKLTAVQKERFIILDSSYTMPGIRNVAGVRQLAQALYPDRFKQ